MIAEFERVARRNNLSLFQEKQRAPLAGRRILLAEDMEINAEIMVDVLSMEDMEADHAENGRIAVEMFAESAPYTYAAILMDVRMPAVCRPPPRSARWTGRTRSASRSSP